MDVLDCSLPLKMFSFLFSVFFSLHLYSKPLQFSTSPRILPQPTGMCLVHTEEGFNSIQQQLLFKWRLFCDDLCGKDRGHSQSFLQISIKERLSIPPPSTHSAPHFHLLQLLHPTLLWKKACSSSSLMLLGASPEREATIQFPLLGPWPPFVLFLLLAGQQKKGREKNAMKVINRNNSTFLNHGDLAVTTYFRASET